MTAKKKVAFPYELSNVSSEWVSILNTEELPKILDSVINENITPSADKIFEFARLTPLDKVKVVILGQDPYPRAGDAHGLAFSCLTGVPASLKNIYKCLMKHGLINDMPKTGNLDYWASQGVLLLNTSLTTIVGKSNEHTDIWIQYTIYLIESLAKLRPMIFMLWGNNAKNYESIIHDTNPECTVYKWTHPSPLAQTKQSFTECPHFTDANRLLMKLGQEPIDWNVEPPQNEVELAFHAGPKTQVVFTDGSCYPNKSSPQSRGGYAAAFAIGTMKDTVLYGNIDTSVAYASNQRAEGTAIWKTMEYLRDHINEWEETIIVSDSEFWIKMFEIYMPSWERTDKFEEKKNPDMTKPMWELYSELINQHYKSIQFRHMKSHGKDGWDKKEEGSYEYFCFINNKYVDELASYARSELQPNEHMISNATYEQ